MSEEFKEIYAKEKIELNDLVQEWINETKKESSDVRTITPPENITCKCRKIELQYKQN